MKIRLQKVLSVFLAVLMLVGIVPMNILSVNSFAAEEPRYKVEIVSYVRGEVTDLRCSELLEARIYRSDDGEQTWYPVTEVDGVPVSKLTYTWTNGSENTLMVVYLTHNMAEADIYGDTAEGTFTDGSSTAVGAQWAALKTPGYLTTGGIGGWPSWGGGFWPGMGGGSGSSTQDEDFEGYVSVKVSLPNGNEIDTDTCDSFGKPDLSADLNNIAIGMFEGETKTLLDLLAESCIVHINCTMCNVSNVSITNNDNEIEYNQNRSTLKGLSMGEADITMTVSKEGCTVHHGQKETVSTKAYVFKKPTTSTTTTTLTLAADSLDTRCKYYINGVEGTKQNDNSIIFTGLDPDTTYTVDVVATFGDGKKAYAYVSDTTKPMYIATVNTYLNGIKMDVADIHGENISLYIKADGGAEAPLTHIGTGVYTATVESGVYYVYHKENGGNHIINNNPLIIAGASASVDVHHYSVTYNANGGKFVNDETAKTENFASGKEVTVISEEPSRDGYVFAGWSYGTKTYYKNNVVTNSISNEIILTANWERKVNVFVNVDIDHTYKDDKGDTHADVNALKDEVSISLVARENSTSAYLEVPGCDLDLENTSHSGHTLIVDGEEKDSYAGVNEETVKNTLYKDGQTATFIGLSGEKQYFVTVDKVNYDASVTAKQESNGDWVIDVSLKYNPTSKNLEFEVKMDEKAPTTLYPKAAIVKVLYYDTEEAKWKVITQHDNGKPGVRVEITGKEGNEGSYPVWTVESNTGVPYGYRVMVSAFVYPDGTIVPTTETLTNEKYSDGNYTATASASGGETYSSYNGAYFHKNTLAQVGTLEAVISLKSHNVTFDAQGGTVNGNASQTVTEQYFIPDFAGYQPTMAGHEFLGWWYKDANGNYTNKAKANEVLTEDVTLYAMWSQNLEGVLTLEGTYKLGGNTIEVWDDDRATDAIVVLQEITADSVNTIDYENVTITWVGDIGTSTEYNFVELDPLKQYRINVLLTNYSALYQNYSTASGTYNENDYIAVYPADSLDTFVNAKLSFTPESYYQPISVDATQIGSTKRPNKVTTEIWYTERNTSNPYKVISQHTVGGIEVSLDADGKTVGEYKESVWNQNFNGNLYDYILKVSETDAVTSMPISIKYSPSSNFDTLTGKPKHTLTATLIPNRYNVIYDLNTDGDNDVKTKPEEVYTASEAHVWSYDTEITYAPTREGYVFKGWTADKSGYQADTNDRDLVIGRISADTHDVLTLTATWEKADYKYTVKYYYDGALKETIEHTAKYLDVINTVFENKVVYDSKNYALDHVVGQPLEIKPDEVNNVIEVYYATDNWSDEHDTTNNTPDGIPDKYQALVSFEIVNGTWNNESDAKTRVYTIYEKAQDGTWNKLSNVTVGTIPEGTANAGLVNTGVWSPSLTSATPVERSATYTLAFNEDMKYIVTVIVENGVGKIADPNVTETFSNKSITVIHNGNLSLEFAANSGFALDYIVVDGVKTVADGTTLNGWNSYPFEAITTNHTIRVVYYKDTFGENGEEPDNIPDKYQKKVIFKVVNGSWSNDATADITKYVTLKKDGKWAEDGSADMPEVPTGMKANAGFKKGVWNVETFPQTLSGTNTVTYTHTFKPIAFVDYIYTVEHHKQLPSGIYALAETETKKLTIELNADENGFENTQSAETAVAKDYGAHYSENTVHADRVASGTPEFNNTLKLKLFYALDSHIVKYDLNGGSAVSGVDYSDVTLLCGNEVTVKPAPRKTGYTFEGWLSDSGETFAANDKIILEKNVTLTAQWAKQTGLSYIVRYLENGTNKVINPEKYVGNKTFEDVVDSSSEVIDIDDYVFFHAEPESLTINVTNNVINLYYDVDTVGGGENGEDSDNIPDKYQKKVIFKVVNGTWNGTNSDDKIKYVTLKTNGNWDVNGEATVDSSIVPTGMTANQNFKNGAWDVTFPVTVKGTDDVTYTYSFDRSTAVITPSDTVKYMVEHYKANSDGSYPASPTDLEVFGGKIGDTVTAVPKQYDGYCVNPKSIGTVNSGTLVSIDSMDDIVVLKLYYDADVLGGGKNGEDPDEIPDKFQKKVIFKVVNGTWDGTDFADIIKYVTLMKDGKWDISGEAKVDFAIVPADVKANEGFINGAWDEAFPVTVKGTEAVTYTHSFDRSTTPVVPSDTVKYMVEHYKANSNGSYPVNPTEAEILSGKIGETVTATAKEYEGYCVNLKASGTVSGAKLTAIETADDIVFLKLYYDADVLGGGDKGDKADEIPDKYQKKLIFKVVNGTWKNETDADITVYVTLTKNGEWDEKGTATLDPSIIPSEMIAKEGFKDGAWDKTIPVAVEGENDESYTFSFVAEEKPIPDTGDNSNLFMWFALMLMSAMSLFGFGFYSRKKKESKI